MAASEFYRKDDLQNELLCAICTDEFDVPKVLPCGYSICTSCESRYFKSSEQQACESCSEHHEMPANGFPVNNLVQKIRTITAKTVYRGELHEKTMESINKVGAFNRKFEYEISSLESMVIDHCDLLRDNVDLKTESAIDAIQTHREKYVNEINEYQKQCIARCGNLEEFNKFMMESKEKYKNWAKFINQLDVKDKEIDDVLKESQELLNKLNIQEKKLDIHIFGAQKLQFVENEPKLSSNILGSLINVGLFNTGLNNLLQNKPQFEINYKTETQPIRYSSNSTICMKIDDGRFCIAVSMSDQYYGHHYYLKLKLFSKNGSFINEISEQLCNSYPQLGATRIKESIVIQAYSISGHMILRSYNNYLDLIKNVNVKYYNSTLFSDNERLYVYYFSHNFWTIYDENLNQIEQIATGNGTSYPFIQHNTSQVELKYGRLFIYYNNELKVVDNKTRIIIKTIKLCQIYPNQSYITLNPVSSETFMIIDRNSKQVCVFNFDLECLMDFKIENINQITTVSLTGDDNVVIYDNTATKAYLF